MGRTAVAGAMLMLGMVCAPDVGAELTVFPARVVLRGAGARQQIVVGRDVDGAHLDFTRDCRIEPADASLVTVAGSVVTAVRDGRTELVIQAGGESVRVPVEVVGSQSDLRVSYELDVLPIFTRLGCNAGACHGKARGQNGFQLSLLGFYPESDHAALAKEGRGRRVFPTAPHESLLLKKGAGLVPHGGGRRFDPYGPAYNIIAAWIEQGLPRSQPTDPVIQKIEVYPPERILGNDASQQLVVTAFFSDGTTRDATALSAFQSNESGIVAVDPHGVVRSGPIPGEAAIMARFLGQIATSNILIPLPGSVPAETYASLPRTNPLDGPVWDKLQRLRLVPSDTAPETTWLRRVYLDVIGRLPTPEEIRTFVADVSPRKRETVVDALLARPEYVDFWANKWMDLLRPNPYRAGIKATFSIDSWVRDAFRRHVPYDQFVRDIVTAEGSTWTNGATTIFRDRREPDERTTIISQLFLGIRLECAKCHHHPFERYGQEDFYAFGAYFARTGYKGVGLSPPISGGEEIIFTRDSGSVKHPLTGVELPPKPLYGTADEVTPDEDPRRVLAKWMTADDNPYFSRVAVNRIWADLMGRGLVEPVDDLRATNPPANAPLLDALAAEFVKHRYDQRQLIKTIVLSHVYELSSAPTERNLSDVRNYSRHYRQRLRAETLLDAVCDITGIPESFQGVPPGSRATEIWTHRVGSVFLDSFGRPDGSQDPPCERTGETTVVQVLHLMNSAELQRKVTAPEGRIAQLAASERTPRELVEELYLLAYSRFPTDEERTFGEQLYAMPATEPKPDPVTLRKQATEDLLWALINTPEFVFKD